MKTGDRVHVDFISESRTEFSNNHFTGDGIIDCIDGDRIYGRLLTGERLFNFDVGIGYRIPAVQIGYVCWCKGDKEFVI